MIVTHKFDVKHNKKQEYNFQKILEVHNKKQEIKKQECNFQKILEVFKEIIMSSR